MKFNYLLSASLLIITLLGACTSNSSEKKSIMGKWSFKTLDGKYAELWTDENALLTVREGAGVPYIFDYLQKGDTIIIYQYGQKSEPSFELDRFLLEESKDEQVTILQDTVHNTLSLISDQIDNIQNTEACRNAAQDEFRQRAAKAK